MKIIYVMSLTEDIRNMHQRIQFLHSKPQEKKVFQAVECDIHETAKNKKGKRRFVIMHDQTLNRMCGLSGKKYISKEINISKDSKQISYQNRKQY